MTSPRELARHVSFMQKKNNHQTFSKTYLQDYVDRKKLEQLLYRYSTDDAYASTNDYSERLLRSSGLGRGASRNTGSATSGNLVFKMHPKRTEVSILNPKTNERIYPINLTFKSQVMSERNRRNTTMEKPTEQKDPILVISNQNAEDFDKRRQNLRTQGAP